MILPHGPKAIPKNRQVALPTELLGELNIEIGDSVYFARSEEVPGAMLVIPVELVADWIERGRRATHESDAGETSTSAGAADVTGPA